MPARRWRMGRRAQLSPGLRLCLEVGTHAAWDEAGESLEGLLDGYFFTDELTFEALWREHGAGILAEWIPAHPGSRPWAWWRWDAPEPRAIVEGAELLQPGIGESFWREHLGLPAFVQSRPRGYDGLPAVESQAAYLRRLGLFVGDEGRRVRRGAYAPEEVDPFLTSEGELEELQAEGARRRAEERVKTRRLK